ncbi:hypothetical protein SAMN05421665_1582 [Yoonia rosea]|uniref:Uncharacterized protein n=1 Tax=Yoonia rosea TaxID=287098 RepID=A0A1R3WX38_9RHOB|nr:hypothetical protein [Yoonia rosea]SIT83012.1 hypothetical protein SAMN05421665_1582 [Yoonia rosea]
MNDVFSMFLRNLLSDDTLLRKFLADPVKTGGNAGLSKAQWSVLRRVMVEASTASTNGYSVVRPLSGYRQAAKMLYNVMRQQSISALASPEACAGTVSIAVSWGPDPANPGQCPFQNIAVWQSAPVTGPVLISDVMDQISSSHQLSVYSSQGGNFALSFADDHQFDPKRIIGSFDIHGTTYTAPPQAISTHAPFWFWSINGYPNPHDSGSLAESYATKKVNSGDVVYWDCVAPGPQYGFPACAPTDGMHTQNLA